MTSLPHIPTGGYIIFGSLKKGYSSADINCMVSVYLKYMCQNISLKTCACSSNSLFVNAIYVTITRIKRPLCVSYIMLHTYTQSPHNDALSISDNTTQNAGKLDFFLNNQPDALIIQIYSVIKLYTFRASSLPIIRSFLLYIRHW
jgi:hypothetical protein